MTDDQVAVVLNAVTALATAGAVVVAAWAVVSSQRAIRIESTHSRLAERRAALVQLLAALEEIQTLLAPDFADDAFERNASNGQLKLARARYRGLLRASEEPLPIARQDAFSHFAYELPAENPPPMMGNPETERATVRVVRAEIVIAIDALREEIAMLGQRRSLWDRLRRKPLVYTDPRLEGITAAALADVERVEERLRVILSDEEVLEARRAQSLIDALEAGEERNVEGVAVDRTRPAATIADDEVV